MRRLFVVTMALLLTFGGVLPATYLVSTYAAPPFPITPAPMSLLEPIEGQDMQLALSYVPGELIVKFKPAVSVNADKRSTSSDSFNHLLASLRVSKFGSLLVLPDKKNMEDVPVLNRYYKIKVSDETDIVALSDKFTQSPDIEFAVPNYILHIYQTPNDTYYWNQWALNDTATAKLRVAQAWDITTGHSDIVVAVLDTGFDVTHPDLNAKNTYTGYDFVNDDWGIQDDQGHGTAVAGIIGAVSNNGQGVAGVSWGAMIMPVKVCYPIDGGASAACPSDAAMNGIRWAADHGADIINMSFGGPTSGFGQIMWQDAVDYAYSKGLIAIASAGNHREYLDNTDSTYYAPAELNHVVAVGATNSDDEDCRPNFLGYASNCGWGDPGTGYGPELDVMAPGSTDIWTTGLGGGYEQQFGGTSAASPFVSGLAALVLSVDPNLTPDPVESLIKANADPLDPYAEGHPNYSFGWGRINAYRTLKAVVGETPPPPPPPPSTDNAAFTGTESPGDGALLSPGQSFTKMWRMRNTGTSTWGSGYSLAFIGGDQLNAPSSVSVPSTGPGSTADISVSMQAPSTPGEYTGYWRMRNPQGVYFGDTVRAKINVQPQSSNITLSADPPSPASADQVRIYVRVDNFPNLRAMRVLVDGEHLCELGAPEITDCTWHTNGYAAGQHTIVVEVDDWSGPAWDNPQRKSLVYELTGSGPVNHTPNRPTPTSPYDWYVYYSGNTAQLCAQANGDPDGDAITGYYFDIYDSAQSWNSGWVGSNCVTTSALGPYTYQWRVKVRDSHGAESDWSNTWHFTLVNPSLSISELYFEPQDAHSEQVRIRACTTGQGGVGITMRVSVNDANDGSGNGEWHIIKELGVPCFNEVDAPIWHTLEYGDGQHRVRAEARGTDPSWDGAAVREETYTLPHRRPASTHLVAPVPLSEDIREAIYLNSRTVTFRWEPTIRANSYTLHVSTNSSPKDDASPVFRQTFSSSVTAHTVTFSQDYPTLYWQVSATNDVGTNASGDQLFGIDRVAPSCTVQPLSATTYESVFQVNWSGSDNLSGVSTFDIQYLDSGRGMWSDWLTGVPVGKTYELFTGQAGHTYSFRCRATDNANNTGDYPDSADTSILVDPTARPPTPWWDTAYSGKRNLTILNNMPGTTLPASYPVRLHFDSTTTPTVAELYNASQSSPKCNDLRIVYNDTTELDRVVQTCSSSAIDIWFRTQVSIPGGSSDSTTHQLYYGNPNAGTPPGGMNTVFYPAADANTVGLWYMYEGSGSTLHDTSGNNSNCSIDSTTVWVTPEEFSGALRFLGGTDGPTVNCGSSSAFNLQTFTFEMFLKRTGTAWGRLAGHLGDNQNRWLMTFNDNGTIRVSIWPCSTCGAEEFNGNTAIADTLNWHHVAFSLQNSTIKIYVDGQLDVTEQVVWGNIRSGTPPFTVGSAENIQRAFAEISHVRFSNIARTSFPHGTFAAITNEPTVAAGDSVAPPITGSPDLTMLSLSTYPNPGGGVLVQGVMQNQGDLSTQNGFYTDLYLDHVPTGAGDYTGSIQFWVNDPIAAGATVTLTTVITDLTGVGGLSALDELRAMEESSAILYSQTDSTGVVGEPDDVNNIYSAGAEICVAAPDTYESDDSYTSTSNILDLGTSQSHNFHALADEDWLKIQASGGMTYTIRTSNLGASADTYLYLYDTDGTTLLTANDDYGGTLASQIEWTAPMTDTYYVMVKHWNPNVGGCGTDYDLSIAAASGGGNDVYLPIILKGH